MASRKQPLRTVKPDERVDPPRSLTVSEAAESGSQLNLLVAMRTRIARAVEDPNTPARDLAALTKRLADVAREIEHLRVKMEEESGDAPSGVADGVFDASAV